MAGHSFAQPGTAAKTKTGEKIQRLLNELKDSREDPKRVDILLELCMAYMSSYPGKSLYYAKQGLALSKKIYEEIGSKPGLPVAYLGIGLCYNAEGETKKAINYLTRALNIARDINLPESIESAV